MKIELVEDSCANSTHSGDGGAEKATVGGVAFFSEQGDDGGGFHDESFYTPVGGVSDDCRSFILNVESWILNMLSSRPAAAMKIELVEDSCANSTHSGDGGAEKATVGGVAFLGEQGDDGGGFHDESFYTPVGGVSDVPLFCIRTKERMVTKKEF